MATLEGGARRRKNEMATAASRDSDSHPVGLPPLKTFGSLSGAAAASTQAPGQDTRGSTLPQLPPAAHGVHVQQLFDDRVDGEAVDRSRYRLGRAGAGEASGVTNLPLVRHNPGAVGSTASLAQPPSRENSAGAAGRLSRDGGGGRGHTVEEVCC